MAKKKPTYDQLKRFSNNFKANSMKEAAQKVSSMIDICSDYHALSGDEQRALTAAMENTKTFRWNPQNGSKTRDFYQRLYKYGKCKR